MSMLLWPPLMARRESVLSGRDEEASPLGATLVGDEWIACERERQLSSKGSGVEVGVNLGWFGCRTSNVLVRKASTLSRLVQKAGFVDTSYRAQDEIYHMDEAQITFAEGHKVVVAVSG